MVKILTILAALLMPSILLAEKVYKDCRSAKLASSESIIQPIVKEYGVRVPRATVQIPKLSFGFYVTDQVGNPMGNVKIIPLLVGITNPKVTHPDLSEVRFSGIATSPSEWCTDENGYVEISIGLEIPVGFLNAEAYLILASGVATSKEAGIFIERI